MPSFGLQMSSCLRTESGRVGVAKLFKELFGAILALHKAGDTVILRISKVWLNLVNDGVHTYASVR